MGNVGVCSFRYAAGLGMWRWITWAMCVCSFRCAAGGGMWRWVTRAICGCMFLSLCSGRRYVEMGNAVDVRMCVHFVAQREEVCGDG